MKKLYSLFAVVALAVSANAQTNLIPNPGFENWNAGAPDGWYVTGSTVAQSTTTVHGGASSLAYTAPATGNRTTPDRPAP